MKHRIKNTSTNKTTISKLEFEELFTQFYPRVASYTTVILEDREAGEDIAQEVFVYVWENRKQLNFSEGFHSYLFQSAHTRAIDYLRRNKLKRNYIDQSSQTFLNEYESYLNSDNQTLKNLFSKDFEQKLDKLLSQLSEPRRQAFEMVYIDGLKAKEVAEKMQIPIRTVESHIYLTMKHLRKHLSLSDFMLLALFLEIF